MSGTHAKIAPSSLALYVACHASLLLGEPYANLPDTPEQLEGTAAHWVIAQSVAVAIGTMTPQGIPVDEDMLYGRRLWEKATGLYGNVESTVMIPRIHPTECWGTPDWWRYDPIAQVLRVWDYKFGHLFVDVFECWQLIAYALGVVDFLGLPDDTWLELGIVQPRSYHPDGPVRTWGGEGKLRVSDLRTLTEKAKRAVERALTPHPNATPGPHCLLCPARHECRTLQEAVGHVVEFVGNAERVSMDAPALAAELTILDAASDLLEARRTGLQEQAMAMIRRGERVHGYGAGHTKSHAVWNVPPEEVAVLGDMFGVDLRNAKKSVLTPAQAVVKGIDEAVIQAYSFRPPGAAKLVTDSSQQARKVFGASTT